MSRADNYTNDEQGAAGWEHRFGPLYDDARPTRAELEAEAADGGGGDHEGWCDPADDCMCRLDLLVGDDAPWGGAG